MSLRWSLKRIKKYFKQNENKSTACQNVWDSVKVSVRGKFIVLNKYVRKEEIYKMNNLSFFLRKLGEKCNLVLL